MSDTTDLGKALEAAYSDLRARRERNSRQVMSDQSRDVFDAVRELIATKHNFTLGNLAEVLGYGTSNEDYAKFHRLIADVLDEGVVYYSDGEYKIHPRYDSLS